MFKDDIIATRVHRAQLYMPDAELCGIITNGVSQKPVSSIANPQEVHSGLEEGVWSYHLLRYLTNETHDLGQRKSLLEKYVYAINTLSKQPSAFFVWAVDTNDNSWAPVWVRLVDRLKHFVDKKPEFAGLHPELRAKVEEVYSTYKDGLKGVDARRQKHTAINNGFVQLFADPRYAELQDLIRQPVTKEITEKHCCKYILEIQDLDKQKRIMALYLDALCQNPTSEVAQRLITHLEKDVPKFSEEYTRQPSADVCKMITDRITAFRK